MQRLFTGKGGKVCRTWPCRPQSVKKKLALAVAALIIVIGGVLFYYNSREKVEVLAAGLGTISYTIEENGYTRAGEFYELQAPSSGPILLISAVNGQQVKAGDVLMQMQDLSLEASLAEVTGDMHAIEATVKEAEVNLQTAYLNLDESQKNLSREKTLLDAQAISQTEYDNAVIQNQKCKQAVVLLQDQTQIGKKQLAALAAEQNSLSQKLGELQIKSPINGKVMKLPVKNGQIVAAGTVLIVIGTPNQLEVYTEILSSDAVKIEPGQPATVTYGSDSQSLTGRVKEVFPQAEERISALNVRERRVPVVVYLDENGALQPGYEVKVAIRCSTHENALVIPREALISSSGGEDKVRVVQSGRVVTRLVATGLKNQLQAEILKGINPGELVVLNGSISIDDHERVKTVMKSSK